MLRAGLVNFSKGVLSPALWGRIDVAAYNAGLKRGDNIVILKHGGFRIRPGFRFVSECLAADERLVSFQFSDEQPYALAFGQAYLQPMSVGGVVVETELAIIGITNTSPAIVNVAYHGYAVGDRWFVDGVADPLGSFVNGRVFQVTSVPDANHFGIDLDATALPAFTTATGGATNSAPPPPPPPPPPVPPVYVPPDPPLVYSGGGGGAGGGTVRPGTWRSIDGSDNP